MSRGFQISPFLKQCFITAVVDLTTVGFGSTLGFPAILFPQLRDPSSTVTLTKETESWIASVYALGMICGFFLTPPIMDRFGRKKAHYAVTALFILGWIIILILPNETMAFIITRILHGIGAGLLTTVSTVLIGECTSPNNRGAFITTLALSQSAGILLVHFLGYVLSWQYTVLVCLCFPFTSLVLSMYIPESPSWLLSKTRYDKFQKNFRWFRGDAEEHELISMLRAKSDAVKMETAQKEKSNRFFSNLKETLVSNEFYKPIIIMIHSNALLQFAGGNILVTYSHSIVSLMMGPEVNVYLWTVFIDMWRIFANIVAVFVIHNFKRRTMIVCSTGFCIFCHVIIVAYLYGSSAGWLQQSLWMPVLFLSLQLFSNAAGIVPMRSVLAGELFPLRYRGIGGSISFASGSILMFLVLKTFPTLVVRLQLYGTYIFYGLILLYSLTVIWFMLPETKGKTLQEIEDEFKGNKENDRATVNIEVLINKK